MDKKKKEVEDQKKYISACLFKREFFCYFSLFFTLNTVFFKSKVLTKFMVYILYVHKSRTLYSVFG